MKRTNCDTPFVSLYIQIGISIIVFVIMVLCSFLIGDSRWAQVFSSIFLCTTILYTIMAKRNIFAISEGNMAAKKTLLGLLVSFIIIGNFAIVFLIRDYVPFGITINRCLILAVSLISALLILGYTFKLLKSSDDSQQNQTKE